MEGKRRYKRYTVDLFQVGGKMLRTSKVALLEMVSDEVTLMADMRLEIGRAYSLKLIEDAGITSLKGTIIWSLLSGTIQGSGGDVIPQYKAMLKVANTVEDVMLRIKHLIKKEGEELMSEAVKVFADEAKTAILDFPEEYRTKTINLGGMLIEASNRAEIEQRLPMEIVLPNGTPVKVQCRVANCRPVSGTTPERYDIGVEFVDMTVQDKVRLNEFISLLDKHQL